MTVAGDLLERIVADPDDHATRLVYGDALGGDRGEAITIGIELANAGIASIEDLVFSPVIASEQLERRALQLRRLRKLHADKGDTWTLSLGEDGLAGDGVSGLEITFRNGWASKAEVSKNTIDTFARFSQRSPITCVALRIFEQEPLAAFAKLPLQNVRELEINGPPTPLDWTVLFAALPNLRSLTWATLAEPDEVAAFADHPALRELELTNPSDANLARLIGGACARRLERLSMSGSYQSWDRRSAVFDDPLRVFTGVFPNAHAITVNWLGVTDAHCLAARGLAFPRTTGLTSMNFTGRGLRALAYGFGAVRDLDVVGAELDDGALEALVATAPQVERTRISMESVTDAGIRSLSALRLKRLGLFDTTARPATLASIVADHDLEAYRIQARTPLDTEFWQALIREPRAASLRSLHLKNVTFDDDTARTLARSPHFAGLRELVLDDGPTLGARADDLLGLPWLVSLTLEDCNARPSLAQATHPTLVEVAKHEALGTSDVRAAHHERFGGEYWERSELYLFVARPITHATLGELATAAGLKFYDDERSLRVFEPELTLRVEQECRDAALAAAIASPAAARLITSAECVVDIHFVNPTIAEVVPLATRLLAMLGGVLWNVHDDVIIEAT